MVYVSKVDANADPASLFSAMKLTAEAANRLERDMSRGGRVLVCRLMNGLTTCKLLNDGLRRGMPDERLRVCSGGGQVRINGHKMSGFAWSPPFTHQYQLPSLGTQQRYIDVS